MLEITLFLGWLSLDDVKSYNTNRDLLLYKNILMRYYNKSVDVKKPYIQYIAVKVMNNVSRKSLDWHPYKAAGIPGLPYKDIFIIDVNIRTLLTKGLFCYRSLET